MKRFLYDTRYLPLQNHPPPLRLFLLYLRVKIILGIIIPCTSTPSGLFDSTWAGPSRLVLTSVQGSVRPERRRKAHADVLAPASFCIDVIAAVLLEPCPGTLFCPWSKTFGTHFVRDRYFMERHTYQWRVAATTIHVAAGSLVAA